MGNGCVVGQQTMFERPDHHMQHHLKPLFIQAKINDVGINKVLVNGGAAVNLLPHFLLKKIGLSDSYLKPHNVDICNYEGKSGSSFGAVEVDLVVGTVKRPTSFLVVESKANYNLLLVREWIHGVGAVPSTMHKRLSLWKENGVLGNIEVDQSYFVAEVVNITKKTIDKQLARIGPRPISAIGYESHGNFLWSMKLHPKDGFIWKKECVEDNVMRTRAFMCPRIPAWGHPEIGVSPSGWEDFSVDDD